MSTHPIDAQHHGGYRLAVDRGRVEAVPLTPSAVPVTADGYRPAAECSPRSLPAAGHLSRIETGHDIGGLFTSEMFPQHTKRRK